MYFIYILLHARYSIIIIQCYLKKNNGVLKSKSSLINFRPKFSSFDPLTSLGLRVLERMLSKQNFFDRIEFHASSRSQNLLLAWPKRISGLPIQSSVCGYPSQKFTAYFLNYLRIAYLRIACTYVSGFQIDDCVFQSCFNFANLKVQGY